MVFSLADNLSDKIGRALNHRDGLESVSLKEGFSDGIAYTLSHCAQNDNSSLLLLSVCLCCCRVVTLLRRFKTSCAHICVYVVFVSLKIVTSENGLAVCTVATLNYVRH